MRREERGAWKDMAGVLCHSLGLLGGWAPSVLRAQDFLLAPLFLGKTRSVPADAETDAGGHDCGILATQRTIYHRLGNKCGIKTFNNTSSWQLDYDSMSHISSGFARGVL